MRVTGRADERARLDEEQSAALVHARADTAVDRQVLEHLVEAATGDRETLLAFIDGLGVDELAGRRPLPAVLPYPAGQWADEVRKLDAAELDLALLLALDRTGRFDVLERAHGGSVLRALLGLELRGALRISGNRVLDADPRLLSEVLRNSPPWTQRAAHRRLSDALTLGEDADLRAMHLALSTSDADETVAQQVLEAAPRAARRSGAVAAADMYEAAAALAAEPSLRGECLVLAAEAAWEGGAPARAGALLARSAGSPLSSAGRGRAARVAGMMTLARGRQGDAFRHYLDGAASAAPDGAELLARAIGIAWWEGRHDWAIRGAESALLHASEATPLGRVVRLAAPAGEMLFAGRLEEAARGFAKAVELEPEMEDLRGLLFLGEVASLFGDDEAGMRLHRRAFEVARQSDDSAELPFALQVLGMLHASAGRLWEARAMVEQGLRAADAQDEERRGSYQLALLAQLDALVGDEDACRAHAARVMGSGAGGDIAVARWALGRLELVRGRAETALEELKEVFDAQSGHPVFRLYVIPDLVEVAVQAGDLKIAAEALDLFARWASAGAPWARAVLPRLRGLLAEPGDAGAHLREAVEAASGRLFDHARARYLMGRHLRRVRRRVESRDELRAAMSAFDTLGLAGWGALVRRELRASGEVPPGEGEAPDLRSLTAQELRVARLVVDKGSNRAAAETLKLSARTIEYHLAKVYAKLTINSRAELARLLGEAEGR